VLFSDNFIDISVYINQSFGLPSLFIELMPFTVLVIDKVISLTLFFAIFVVEAIISRTIIIDIGDYLMQLA